jgi:hypothetical protein
LLIGNLKRDIVEDRDLMAAAGQAHCQVRDGNHVVCQAPQYRSRQGYIILDDDAPIMDSHKTIFLSLPLLDPSLWV